MRVCVRALKGEVCLRVCVCVCSDGKGVCSDGKVCVCVCSEGNMCVMRGKCVI